MQCSSTEGIGCRKAGGARSFRGQRGARSVSGSIAGTSLLWGFGFAALEAAYFTRANAVYPLGGGHALLVLLLAVEFALISVAASIGTFLVLGRVRSLGRALLPWTGPWLLTLVLAVSHYRDRMVLHARTTGDLAITAAIMLGFGLALLGIVRVAAARPPALTNRVLVALGLAILLGGGGWLVTARSSAPPAIPAKPFEVGEAPRPDDTGLRVLLIGMDGGEWGVIDALAANGELPAYAGVAASGRTARLETITPTFSPIIWTSVATGKAPDKHRISSHVFTRLPLGLPVVAHDPTRIKFLTKLMKANLRLAERAGAMPMGVYSARNLRARQLWDVLGEYGMRSVTLEWYITHPVSPVAGVLVSDRFHLLGSSEQIGTQAVYPESLAARLAPAVVEAATVREELFTLLDASDLDEAGRRALEEKYPKWFRTLGNEMARDLTTRNLLEDSFAQVPDWRLGAVYYRAMDGSHHTSWRWRGLSEEGVEGNSDRRFRDVVDGYTRFCDGTLEQTLRLADENTVVIVVSDHGWENQLWGHARKPDGIFMVAGGPTIPSPDRGDVSIFDIAPTVLALLGVAAPDDMDGRVLAELFAADFWEAHPVRRVPTYERPRDAIAEGEEGAVDERILQQLEALGYVGD